MSDARDLLREPWSALDRQTGAATFGVWVFIASELLFFGGLLLVYAIYRGIYPAGFEAAARETNIWYGTINTAVLLTSSLTMAVASQAARADFRRLVIFALVATALFGTVFAVLKGFEYREDIDKHLVPGQGFALSKPGAEIFFAIYWIITGLHAVHLTIGIALVSRLAFVGATGRMRLRGSPQVEATALYWHLVDVIWIFLYPLIYLPGRSS
jgi:cytochrome c oxidase subunit 3